MSNFRENRSAYGGVLDWTKILHMLPIGKTRAESPATGPPLYHISVRLSIGNLYKNFIWFLVKMHKKIRLNRAGFRRFCVSSLWRFWVSFCNRICHFWQTPLCPRPAIFGGFYPHISKCYTWREGAKSHRRIHHPAAWCSWDFSYNCSYAPYDGGQGCSWCLPWEWNCRPCRYNGRHIETL